MTPPKSTAKTTCPSSSRAMQTTACAWQSARFYVHQLTLAPAAVACRYFEAVPLSQVHSRLRPCPPVDKRSIFGFGVCTDAAALQLPFEEHACRSLEQVCGAAVFCVRSGVVAGSWMLEFEYLGLAFLCDSFGRCIRAWSCATQPAHHSDGFPPLLSMERRRSSLQRRSGCSCT